MNSSSPITCIECGHYPVSSAAERCPSCGKEKPTGVECRICHEFLAYSKAERRSSDFYYQAKLEREYSLLNQEFACGRSQEVQAYIDKRADQLRNSRDANLEKFFYFHNSCLQRIKSTSFYCKICDFHITEIVKNCPKCAEPIAWTCCSYCAQEIVYGREIRADFLGQGGFHEHCAALRGGENWREALEAEKMAKLEEEKRQQKEDLQRREEERRRREDAERIKLERAPQAELERVKEHKKYIRREKIILGIKVSFTLIFVILNMLIGLKMMNFFEDFETFHITYFFIFYFLLIANWILLSSVNDPVRLEIFPWREQRKALVFPAIGEAILIYIHFTILPINGILVLLISSTMILFSCWLTSDFLSRDRLKP